MRDTVTSSRPAAGFEEVLIAGDPEWRSDDSGAAMESRWRAASGSSSRCWPKV